MSKFNKENIKDFDGICTLLNITKSDELADFYNDYVIPNNIEKYAAISKNGIVYSYDNNTKKHIKIGIQKDTGARIFAKNPMYKPEQQTEQVPVEQTLEEVNVQQQPVEHKKQKEAFTAETPQASQKQAHINVSEDHYNELNKEIARLNTVVDDLQGQISYKDNVIDLLTDQVANANKASTINVGTCISFLTDEGYVVTLSRKD